LREVIARFGCDPSWLPSQDILLSNIGPRTGRRSTTPCGSRRHRRRRLTPVRRWSLACPALADLRLALTEAERIQTPLIDAIEERLERTASSGEIQHPITGCPNAAAPYAGDVGLSAACPLFRSMSADFPARGSASTSSTARRE